MSVECFMNLFAKGWEAGQDLPPSLLSAHLTSLGGPAVAVGPDGPVLALTNGNLALLLTKTRQELQDVADDIQKSLHPH